MNADGASARLVESYRNYGKDLRLSFKRETSLLGD
jgi:hypothetical protein